MTGTECPAHTINRGTARDTGAEAAAEPASALPAPDAPTPGTAAQRTPEAPRDSTASDSACVANLATYPRAWRDALDRLEAMPAPPRDIPVKVWAPLLAGTRSTLEAWGPQLAALGWTVADVFRAHSTMPWHADGQKGLALFLFDRRVIAATANAARLQFITGDTKQTFDLAKLRRIAGPGRVLLWEIQ